MPAIEEKLSAHSLYLGSYRRRHHDLRRGVRANREIGLMVRNGGLVGEEKHHFLGVMTDRSGHGPPIAALFDWSRNPEDLIEG